MTFVVLGMALLGVGAVIGLLTVHTGIAVALVIVGAAIPLLAHAARQV